LRDEFLVNQNEGDRENKEWGKLELEESGFNY
jgi:hypothetical protein